MVALRRVMRRKHAPKREVAFGIADDELGAQYRPYDRVNDEGVLSACRRRKAARANALPERPAGRPEERDCHVVGHDIDNGRVDEEPLLLAGQGVEYLA